MLLAVEGRTAVGRFVVQPCVTKTGTGGVQQQQHHHLHSSELEHQSGDGTMLRKCLGVTDSVSPLARHAGSLSEMLRSSTERHRRSFFVISPPSATGEKPPVCGSNIICVYNHYMQNIQHIFSSTCV